MKHIWIKGQSDKTLVMLHGTGGNEHDLLGVASMIDPNANILSIRGNIVESGMPRFFKRLSPGVFDEVNLIEETHHLYNFISEAVETYDLKRKHMIFIGYSNGANIAASLLFHYDNPMMGAILLRPMVPLLKEEVNDLNHVKILILAAENDQLVDTKQAELLHQMLIDRHAQSKLVFMKSGHQITEKDLVYARQWYTNRFK